VINCEAESAVALQKKTDATALNKVKAQGDRATG